MHAPTHHVIQLIQFLPALEALLPAADPSLATLNTQLGAALPSIMAGSQPPLALLQSYEAALVTISAEPALSPHAKSLCALLERGLSKAIERVGAEAAAPATSTASALARAQHGTAQLTWVHSEDDLEDAANRLAAAQTNASSAQLALAQAKAAHRKAQETVLQNAQASNAAATAAVAS